MSDLQQTSQRLASRLGPGEHRLSNARLRSEYGLSRITARARSDIADALERQGLTIVSNPGDEPLVVRKTQLARARPESAQTAVSAKRPWWQIAVGAVVVLLVVAGLLGGGEEPTGDPGATQTGAGVPPKTAPSEPAETFDDAVQAADDDDYTEALAIAAALGDGERSRIRRRISRRLAARARAALRDGRRGRARRLLAEARDYPRTRETTAARTSLRVADERAAARREQRRIAREQARVEREQAAAAAEAQRRAEEEAAAAPEPEPSAPSVGEGTCAEVGVENFEVPPGDERDADGDGIACES